MAIISTLWKRSDLRPRCFFIPAPRILSYNALIMTLRSPYLTSLLLWLALITLSWFALPYLPWPLSPAWRLFASLNIASFTLFALDKIQAQTRGRRVPERLLYLATLAGGSAGSLLSMWLLRHKTRKVGFQVVMACLLLIQILIFLRYQQWVKTSSFSRWSSG